MRGPSRRIYDIAVASLRTQEKGLSLNSCSRYGAGRRGGVEAGAVVGAVLGPTVVEKGVAQWWWYQLIWWGRGFCMSFVGAARLQLCSCGQSLR